MNELKKNAPTQPEKIVYYLELNDYKSKCKHNGWQHEIKTERNATHTKMKKSLWSMWTKDSESNHWKNLCERRRSAFKLWTQMWKPNETGHKLRTVESNWTVRWNETVAYKLNGWVKHDGTHNNRVNGCVLNNERVKNWEHNGCVKIFFF